MKQANNLGSDFSGQEEMSENGFKDLETTERYAIESATDDRYPAFCL